jgi:uncharacterized protein (TIGR03437 family)
MSGSSAFIGGWDFFAAPLRSRLGKLVGISRMFLSGVLLYAAALSSLPAQSGIPITNLSPGSNLLAPGTTSFTLTFNTIQPASCAYSTGTLLPFSSMQPISGGQGTTQHQGTISGISANPQVLNTVYLQCDSNPDFVDTLQYRVVGARNGPFPRLGSIWQGEYILTTKPDQAAKMQIYFGPGGMTTSQTAALRAQNPNILVLPSVNSIETTSGTPVVPDSYYLKDVNGNKISDWPGNYLLNLTNPQVAAFLAQYAFQQYFVNANFAYDGLFWDNFDVNGIAATYIDYMGVAHQIDANGDGIPDDQATLNAAWNQGLMTLISDFHALTPNAYCAGHISQSPPSNAILQYFNGASFTEDAPRVREGKTSFSSLLNAYNDWFAGGQQPAVATIQSAPPSQIAYGYGYQPLQNLIPSTIQFAQTYYPYMRFGLTLAMLNDGFSIFDFGDNGAPVNWWYDEYDFNLGYPVAPAAQVGTSAGAGGGTSLLANGSFEQNLASWSLLVNNDGQAKATDARDTTMSADGAASVLIQVLNIGTSQWHVDFEQDDVPLTAGAGYRVQFWARADANRSITVYSQGGAPNYPNYGLNQAVSLTPTWQFFEADFTAPVTATDGRIEFWMGDRKGSVWLDGVTLIQGGSSIYRRDYSNGTVLVNGTSSRQTIPIESGFRKFSGSQAPLWQYIVDDVSPDFTADSSWQTVTYDTGQYQSGGNYQPPFYHAWNSTAHLQSTAGTAAQWNLNIPADGQYTLQVWLPAAPAASNWTRNAIYEVVSNGVAISTDTLDQTSSTAGDGWHTVFTGNLTVAGAPILRVHNGGTAPLLADAVYISSAALFNDGSPVSQVTLGPFDGILLQRNQGVPAPTSRVNSVLNAASYQPAIASGGFVSIMGTGFSNASRLWAPSDFSGTNLPAALDGVSVSIDGKPAYVEYISPTQINAIAPDDPAIGPVQVQVSTPQGPSYSATVVKQQVAPAFFTYLANATTYAAATHVDGTLVGPAGANSRPAIPGEVIQIYGTGFGATNPASVTAQQVAQPTTLATLPVVIIGGTNAQVQWGGLISAGLYQLNVIIPNLSGDQPIQANVRGFASPSNLQLSIASN